MIEFRHSWALAALFPLLSSSPVSAASYAVEGRVSKIVVTDSSMHFYLSGVTKAGVCGTTERGVAFEVRTDDASQAERLVGLAHAAMAAKSTVEVVVDDAQRSEVGRCFVRHLSLL